MIQVGFHKIGSDNSRFSKTLVYIIASWFLFFLPFISKAQYQNYIQSNASYAEKVYLQLDGKVYTPGNVVWFKCIVADAVSHSPSVKSGVLYSITKGSFRTDATFPE